VSGMRQLFFVKPGRVEWREVPLPALADDADALVRPLAVASCDLDVALVHGAAPFPGPFPLGHEGVGEVAAVGRGVTTLTPGQRVIIPFQISCGECGRCRRGRTASCERAGPGAMYGLEPFGGPWGGFLGDLVRVPWADRMLVPLPAGLDPVAVASLSDNIPDAWRTIAPYVSDPAGTTVLIVGGAAPSIPFYAVAIARALGVGQVDYLEFPGEAGNRGRGRDKAARAGARVLPGPGDVRAGHYAITVCSAGDVDALKLTLRATEPDGTCVVNAVFFTDDVPLPMLSMYTRGVRLVTGRVNARAVLPEVLGLVAAGSFRPEAVTDVVVDWADAADAFMASPRKLVISR
jgi:threonine dehydrogenase-like Zn-dependent dehydrogenase